MNVGDLHPRRHEPPADMPPEVFAAVTDALARVLVAAYRRRQHDGEACGT